MTLALPVALSHASGSPIHLSSPGLVQDFEALTPNLLARTVETVEGGGIVVLLLNTMDSLTKLYTMAMDVHARFRTESHQQARVDAGENGPRTPVALTCIMLACCR